MTKRDLVEKLVELHRKREISKAAAEDVVESLFHHLAHALRRTTRFSYPGFGTFVVRKRKERTGRNPQTGAAIKIRASKTVAFRPSSDLKAKLN